MVLDYLSTMFDLRLLPPSTIGTPPTGYGPDQEPELSEDLSPLTYLLPRRVRVIPGVSRIDVLRYGGPLQS